MNWNLAELNIAKMMYEADGSEMQDFNAALDPVNALADESTGFVWRLISDDDDPSEELIFNDPGFLVNMSVWNDLESLLDFVRSDTHLAIMKRRREWFESAAEATMVLWWIPEGHIPSVMEAQERLEALRVNGPSSFAFGFSAVFPPPG